MARNIDIFVLNTSSTTTIHVCARANTNCQFWTFNDNSCQLDNNLTTILPNQTGRISLNANTGNNICFALWDGPSIIASTPPTRTIELPITSNSSGFEIRWSSGVLRLIRTLCMTSVPANTSSEAPVVYYQNNTSSTVLVCINGTFNCTSQTRGNNCAPNTITVTPGQLFRTPIASFLGTSAVCITSWLNPDILLSTAPPTNITTVGPDSSISAILINVSPSGVFSSTTHYTCDPTTGPLTTVIVNNCYDVTMTINQIIDSVPIVVPTTSPLDSGTYATIQISKGASIMLFDMNRIRVSNTYIVPEDEGPLTVYFRADNSIDFDSCGITPIIPRVTINNCNTNFNGTLEVVNELTGLWVTFNDPTGQPVIIPRSGGSRTFSLPVNTKIRLNYGDNNITQSFLVSNPSIVNVFFLPNGTASTSQVCPILLSLKSSNVTINNCFNSNLNLQSSTDGKTWKTINGTTVNAKSSSTVSMEQGLVIRLAHSNETTTSGTFTVPNTATSTVFFQSNGDVSTTTCAEESRTGFFMSIIVIISIIIIIIILLFVFAPRAKTEGSASEVHVIQG